MPKETSACIEARARGTGAKPLLIAGTIIALVPVALIVLIRIFPLGLALLAIAFLYYWTWIFVIAGVIMVIAGIVLAVKEHSACTV